MENQEKHREFHWKWFVGSFLKFHEVFNTAISIGMIFLIYVAIGQTHLTSASTSAPQCLCFGKCPHVPTQLQNPWFCPKMCCFNISQSQYNEKNMQKLLESLNALKGWESVCWGVVWTASNQNEQDFKVTWFLGFLVSWFQSFPDAKPFIILLEEIDPILPNCHFMLCW